jgi:ribosomal protein L11 methyltransferase
VGPGGWRWRRLVKAQQIERWQKDLAEENRLVITEFPPPRQTAWLEIYTTAKEARTLVKQWGGKAERVRPARSWLGGSARPLMRVHRSLVLARTASAYQTGRRRFPEATVLQIPAGLAFGTGEHGTTAMLLRRLFQTRQTAPEDFLDLGTGSGVLALAARSRGWPRLVAMDFDPLAMKTARQNERLNFRTLTIDWEEGDVLHWKAPRRFDLITANLYSELLMQSAPRIWRWLKPGGELWLSGVLRTQGAAVRKVFRALGADEREIKVKGKWLMLIFGRNRSSRRPGGLS